MRRFSILAVAGLCLLPACQGWAAFSLYNLTVGRLTENEGLAVFSNTLDYNANSFANPGRDTMEYSGTLHYGYTDRLSLNLGFQTQGTQRDQFTAGALTVGGNYLFLPSWGQVAAGVTLEPSLRGATLGADAHVGVLKNAGQYLFYGLLDSGRTTFSSWSQLPLQVQLSAGVRTGLTGILLPTFIYLRSGEQRLGLLAGGTVGDHMFIGIQPNWGLTRVSPDFQLDLQLHIPFGRPPVGAWGLQ